MMNALRRMLHSKLGVVITIVALGIIALAFALGDVTGLRNGYGGGRAASTVAATVGKSQIDQTALSDKVRQNYNNAQHQRPDLNMAAFVQGGGFDGTLDDMINGLAMEQFGAAQGVLISKRSLDGQIASVPALQDASGKFSQPLYDRFLATQRVSDTQVRDELRQSLYGQYFSVPVGQAKFVPDQIALPYASLLLEKRDGAIAVIPSQAAGPGAPPTDAEITAFYNRNKARYTLAERRTARYAIVTSDLVKAQATPTDAEIAKAYQADHAKYAAADKRDITQVVLLDQKAANAIAAKLKAGGSIEDAAKAAGLEAAKINGVQRDDYTRQTSPDLANAAFSAAKGAVLGPVHTPLGWTVAKIEGVTHDPGKTLDQAKPDIVKQLTAAKTQVAMGKIHDSLDDAIGNNATFDELVSDQKLTAKTTPPVLSTGVDPTNPAAKPDPALVQVATAAFAAEQGDNPQLVPIGTDGTFAVVALGKVVPAAPRALTEIKPLVTQDFARDRASKEAHELAAKVVQAVNKGTSLADALRALGKPLPPPQSLSITRQQVANDPHGARPPLVLMFTMVAKTAKLLEAPNQAGWFVVYVDQIHPGDAKTNPMLLTNTKGALSQVVGREYAEQFAAAIRNQVGVTRNAATIKAVQDQLTGQGASN